MTMPSTPDGTNPYQAAQAQAPLVIGVTGHRDIREEDREELQTAIKDIFVELKGKYSSTPLVLLSPLAEGADRLAANVALSQQPQVRLFVPLPMRQTAYEQDFQGDSLAEFRHLLGQAEGSLELRLVKGNSSQGILRQGSERDLQYEAVGRYIVQKSQILIALWDGDETDLVGGTASTVKFQREGLPPSEPCSLEAPEGFPVYHVLTPRIKNPNPRGKPFRRRVLYPNSFRGEDEKARRYYDRMFSRINQFNRYAARTDLALRQEIAKSKLGLLQNLDEKHFPGELRADLNRYGLADALALRFQRTKVLTDRFLHGIIFLAFFSFVLFAHLSQHPMFLTLSLVLVMVGGSWRIAFRKRDGDTKPEDYRAMAEALRVRFFWRLVGFSDSVTDHYLGKQRTELDWIRNGFRGWDVRSDLQGDTSHEDLLSTLQLVKRYWVDEQQRYFHRASHRDEDRLKDIELWGKALARFAVIVGALLFAAVLYRSMPKLLNHEFFGDYKYEWIAWPVIFVEAALAGAALLHNYGNVMAYREHAKQYTRMEGVFSRAAETLKTRLQDQDNDSGTALHCINKLGREALAENGDWVLLHRERPLEVPHP